MINISQFGTDICADIVKWNQSTNLYIAGIAISERNFQHIGNFAPHTLQKKHPESTYLT